MTTQLVGFAPSSLVRAGDKVRATWTFYGSSWLPAFIHDAPKTAQEVADRLPSLGFAPSHNPRALPGDEAIVFDGVLASSWGTGNTVATLVERLSNLGYPLYNLELTRLERIVATSSTDLQQQQNAAQQQANDDANTNAVFDRIGSALGVAGKTLAVAVVVAAAVAAYVLLRKR